MTPFDAGMLWPIGRSRVRVALASASRHRQLKEAYARLVGECDARAEAELSRREERERGGAHGSSTWATAGGKAVAEEVAAASPSTAPGDGEASPALP
eukprot:CAMPEP_0185441486 /NCGR_PEP_ID=MMETSP1365-20130426/42495_1 /TAXON_ID=38817 /ORGANISM="Gephyrocapsa oceanica, Strain RCC1303" /LENGTH=97 /DNA_ID=CAMNT_0028046959 /DNA_START=22 /DNA_END=313 /DNA_ORIENTATION=+